MPSGCDDKNFGDTLYSETDGKTEVGRNFQARVLDNPNVLVEPKILGIETFGNEGNSQTPSDKIHGRDKAMPESL